MSFLAIAYRAWAIGLISFYAWAGFTGWRLPTTPRQRLDPSVRSSPGGYRSHYFWHSGFSGGK